MKSLPANATIEIAKLEGTAPLIVIGIEWAVGSVTYYADTDLGPTVKSKLLQVGDIEDFIVGDNHSNQNVSITLDDTDGTIKAIIDTVNIYKVNCTIYQYFGGLSSLSDKFVLFKGQIQTPFTWDELQRSVTFTVLSEIESYEVGFSPEEGQLEFVAPENIGKPWPLCFGSPLDVPAQKVGKSIEGFASGILDEDFGIVDPMLYVKVENLKFAYNQEKFLLYWWLLVIRGAKTIGRLAGDVLNDYMNCILAERQIFVTIGGLIEQLNQANILKQRGVNQAAWIQALEEQIQLMSVISNENAIWKQRLEFESELSTFRQDLVKKAYQNAIESFNRIRQIWQEYVNTTVEICRQAKLAKESIRIRGGEKFAQGTEIEILISNVKFRGTFTGDIFHIIAGPIATFKDVTVDTWVKDPDPCAPDDETNGLSIFWLKDDPPVNLTGMYLWVKSRVDEGDTRHIIHVQRQDGLKVVFDLVPWSNDTSAVADSGSMSVDQAIGQLLDAPWTATPWGYVPTDLFAGGWQFDPLFGPVADLNGIWAGSPWNAPEGRTIIAAMASIPGGVNRHEIEVIAHLVYGQSYDSLGDDLLMFEPNPREIFTIIGEDIGEIIEASPIVLKHWPEHVPTPEIPQSLEWRVEAGTLISIGDKDCDVYICNILPSEIKAVFAYRTYANSGQRVFVQVPSKYYIKNESANFDTINVTCLTFPRALKNIPGENWEDDVYVSMTSSVGPNVCDIIQHLIETYTNGGTVNVANFAAVKAKFMTVEDTPRDLYPANFALLDRPNVLDEIARIAWEARCAIYKIGNEFFLKYLAEEPTSNITLNEGDIDSDGNIQVTYTSTDEIITRFVATYHPNYKPLEDTQKPYRIILRHNVKKYGVHTDEVEFHIYNNEELVVKSATFWLIRKANAWKQVQFKTFLYNLPLDTFDCITFAMANEFFSKDDVKSILQSAVYSPTDNSITMMCELPIKAGEMTSYPLYWPAHVAQDTLFPTVIEIEKGFAGGFGPGSGVKGTINDCG